MHLEVRGWVRVRTVGSVVEVDTAGSAPEEVGETLVREFSEGAHALLKRERSQPARRLEICSKGTREGGEELRERVEQNDPATVERSLKVIARRASAEHGAEQCCTGAH